MSMILTDEQAEAILGALRAARNYIDEDLAHERDGDNDPEVIAEMKRFIAHVDAGLAVLGE